MEKYIYIYIWQPGANILLLGRVDNFILGNSGFDHDSHLSVVAAGNTILGRLQPVCTNINILASCLIFSLHNIIKFTLSCFNIKRKNFTENVDFSPKMPFFEI